MRLTRGEKLALWCFAPIVVGFLPPVTAWAAAVDSRVLGLPFLLFWNGLMAALTTVLMGIAVVIEQRAGRR
jgi:hypothetical protein